MSLIPHLFQRPSHLFDQFDFGLGMDLDIFEHWPVAPIFSSNYYKPWRSLAPVASRLDFGSKIIADKDKYLLYLDVQQFAPEEIAVKTIGDYIVVEGKHEEKQDEHGYISRHFVRKYRLPEGHRSEDVISSLTSDGVLTITAPRQQPAIKDGERHVPIITTGPINESINK